jgi:hypothetical protein
MGVSAPPGAKGGDGVQGITNSEHKNGVFGWNMSTSARGGDVSTAAGNGICGYTQVPDGAGVLGVHKSGGHGVFGTGKWGVTGVGEQAGVWGIAKGSGFAGFFNGRVQVQNGQLKVVTASDQAVYAETTDPLLAAIFALNSNSFNSGYALYAKNDSPSGYAGFLEGNASISGSLSVGGDITLANADCAEDFTVGHNAPLEPGTVVIFGDHAELYPSSQAYDKRVAGVISGAEEYKPGIVFDRRESHELRQPIALLGKAYCKVDSSYEPIDIGDLLTTSPTLGHAMKAADPLQAFGAVIGKALRPQKKGQGLIPILVVLR